MATFFLCFTFLCGCVSSPLYDDLSKVKRSGDSLLTAISDPHGLPLVRTEISDLPFYPQQTDQCGPASLATVLAHAGVAKTPEELKRLVYLPARGGSLAVDLVAQARRQGLMAYILQPQLNNIFQELAAGRPVLVMQNLSFSWWPKWHFAVVIGFDLAAQKVTLRSGSESRYSMNLALFVKTWARARHWALVVVPPGDVPVSANAKNYLQASADLEESGQYESAFKAYRSASEKWPEQPLALFGLGNTLMSLERFSEALEAYQKLALLHPNRPEGWNNMAFAYHYLGCTDAAMISIDCALKFNSTNADFLDSKSQLRALPQAVTSCSQQVPPTCPR